MGGNRKENTDNYDHCDAFVLEITSLVALLWRMSNMVMS